MRKDSFDRGYFRDYERKGFLSGRHGDKPYWYSFWVRYLTKRVPLQSRILECGCGLGFFTRRVQWRYKTMGADISFYALASAQKNSPNSMIVGAAAEELPLASSLFDFIAAFELVEHLVSPEAFLDEAYRLLRPRGYLVFSTPNPQSFGAHVKGRRPEWRGMPQIERVAEWHGWRDDTHINVRSIDEWRTLLRGHGFTIERDGTSGLHDIPYFGRVPLILQKVIFTGTFVILSATLGFLPWRYGETYMCCAQKNK